MKGTENKKQKQKLLCTIQSWKALKNWARLSFNVSTLQGFNEFWLVFSKQISCYAPLISLPKFPSLSHCSNMKVTENLIKTSTNVSTLQGFIEYWLWYAVQNKLVSPTKSLISLKHFNMKVTENLK